MLIIWLECDSSLVCVVFTARTNALWLLRNRRNTCLYYCGKIKFRVTRIFCEGNVGADTLVNLGFIHKNHFIGKVLRPLPVRGEFLSPGWVKINTNWVVRGYPSFATCGGIFCGSMREFIGTFSTFLEVQTVMVM